jgi:hypothetical protein
MVTVRKQKIPSLDNYQEYHQTRIDPHKQQIFISIWNLPAVVDSTESAETCHTTLEEFSLIVCISHVLKTKKASSLRDLVMELVP